MLTEKDEYLYHEALVHPDLSIIENPEKVLIIGGGDGKAKKSIYTPEAVLGKETLSLPVKDNYLDIIF